LAAVSGLSLAAVSTPALAGGCGFGGAANCSVGVNVLPSEAPSFGPVTIETTNPMGHLRTVNFQRAPNVSITRIHGMAPTASLADAPSGFTGGCHPSSTNYCRANSGAPVSVQLSAPVAPQPIISAPVISAPVVSAPTPRTWVGQGYDPSKFQPRQYGDNTFTPGIAHIPTSIVDRSPVNAQAILNSGRTVPQPVVSASSYTGTSMVTLPGTTAPNLSYSANNYVPSRLNGGFNAPQPTAPVAVGNNTYASNVAADGTYWEKTSGLTTFGNTVATQVICKRQLPRQVVNPVVNVPVPVPTRVVNPVVRVPVAVPTPVSVPVCTPAARFGAPHRPHLGPHSGQVNNLQARYGAAQGSRWSF